MKKHIRFVTNTAKATVTKEKGKYVIKGVPYTVDDMAMNGIGYMAANNAESSSKYIGHPITLTHPKDEQGRNTSVFTKEGIDFLGGGKVTQTYNKDGVWYFNAYLDEQELRSKKGDGKATGEYFANRLDQGLPIGISTGLFFESNTNSGVDKFGTEYKKQAINQSPDHIAMLHESERPAGGDHTMIATNSEGQEFTVNIDEVIAANGEKESIFTRAMNEISELRGKLDTLITNGYNKKDTNVNVNEDIMKREQALKILGLNADDKIADDTLNTLIANMAEKGMKAKVEDDEDGEEKGKKKTPATNSDEIQSIVTNAVNAAIKPLQDKLAANEQGKLKDLRAAAVAKGLPELAANKLDESELIGFVGDVAAQTGGGKIQTNSNEFKLEKPSFAKKEAK